MSLFLCLITYLMGVFFWNRKVKIKNRIRLEVFSYGIHSASHATGRAICYVSLNRLSPELQTQLWIEHNKRQNNSTLGSLISTFDYPLHDSRDITVPDYPVIEALELYKFLLHRTKWIRRILSFLTFLSWHISVMFFFYCLYGSLLK
jgi:hypothetical protein